MGMTKSRLREERSFLPCISLFRGRKLLPKDPQQTFLPIHYPQLLPWLQNRWQNKSWPHLASRGGRQDGGRGAAVGGMPGRRSHPPTWVNPNPRSWDEAHGAQCPGTCGTFAPHFLSSSLSPLPLSPSPVGQPLLPMLVCCTPPCSKSKGA